MDIELQSAWTTANQAYLMAAIAEARCHIEDHSGLDAGVEPSHSSAEIALSMTAPPALQRLCDIFSLSRFERDALLICAGVELDSTCATVCARTQGGPNPTFALLLASLPEAHWDAISPAAPLRHWHLIELTSAPTIVSSPLRIDESILHFLTGTSYLDLRLEGLVEQIPSTDDPPQSQVAAAQRVAGLWQNVLPTNRIPLIEIDGADQGSRQSVAASICALVKRQMLRTFAATLPTQPADLYAMVRLLDREAMLAGAAILLDATSDETLDPLRKQAVQLFCEACRSPLIVSARHRLSSTLRESAYLDLAKPPIEEQRAAWRASLGPAATSLNGHVEALVEQFNFTGEQIRQSSLQVTTSADTDPEEMFHALWDQCRIQARPRLDDLAQRVETHAGWDALVLPEAQMEMLRSIAVQMRHRSRVYGTWGFAGDNARGLGITALFTGASGTGKTTAAEILANELKLDLYRIDLSQVVSKYIGETEKSLRRIFDAAEDGGSLLFFDEADALFGKRSEVKDSHDRYANIEVSYLLQRMEQYRGLAVLATNMKQAIDSAFLRRIRFVIQFPFPDAGLRERIWQRVLPRKAPTEELDIKNLARLCVTGGNIRNIALSAAFLAAEMDEPIRMTHLLEAARGEYLKIEKPLTDAEIRGWVR